MLKPRLKVQNEFELIGFNGDHDDDDEKDNPLNTNSVSSQLIDKQLNEVKKLFESQLNG